MRLDMIIAFLLIILLAGLALGQPASEPRQPRLTLHNAQLEPDWSRLPAFYTDDPQYDAFLNEYLRRHLSVDAGGIYWGSGPFPGGVDHMWEKDWDAWFLPWVDRGAMGLGRQYTGPQDEILNTLLNVPVDKWGYCYGGYFLPEPNNSLGGYRPNFSWPWPKYNRNTLVDRPTGWEFNLAEEPQRNEWTESDLALAGEDVYQDFRLVGQLTGPKPELISPPFECDVFQIPIVELDLEFISPDERDARQFIEGLRLYWTTASAPDWSEARSVGVDFCDLPPTDFPEVFVPMASAQKARYPLFFPMYLHTEWGREGARITRLKLVPTTLPAEGIEIALNYLRASYDVRMPVMNGLLTFSASKFWLWTGDDEFIRLMMPKLRRSMLFMLEQLRGREEGLLDCNWLVGHDGLGGDEPGHGLIGSYWDLLPAGRFDIESSLFYYNALRALAELERAAHARDWTFPEVSVLGPDDRTHIVYKETAESLDILAAQAQAAIEQRFWVPETGRFCRNIDVYGRQHDYGMLHFNLMALVYGVGTPEQRESILSWLDGRVIPGDTSVGEDLYHWRFAPRTTTRHNEKYWFWPWNWEHERAPDHYNWQWGYQMQNGGAVPMTSLMELITRCRTGRPEQLERAWQRTKAIEAWYAEVQAAGGEGRDFYRAYYAGHPERGRQQGGDASGGLGLDREFLSDSSCGTTFPLYAFLGVNTWRDGVLEIAPALPTELPKLGARNVFYRGSHLTIEAGAGYVSLEGSRIKPGDRSRLEITFPPGQGKVEVLVAGKPFRAWEQLPDRRIKVMLGLRPLKIEVKRSAQ